MSNAAAIALVLSVPLPHFPLRIHGFLVCPYYTLWAYVRHGGLAERRGHQNRERDAGPLQRGVYAGHLCLRHHGGTASGGEHHGQYPIRCCRALTGHFSVWVGAWVKEKGQKLTARKSKKNGENPLISVEIRGFLACHYEIAISEKRCGATGRAQFILSPLSSERFHPPSA